MNTSRFAIPPLMNPPAPKDFDWRGVTFKWNWQRMSFLGSLCIGGDPATERTHVLFVRETMPGTWQGWCEWRGGYTMPCTMSSRDLALGGAALELQSVFQKALDDLAPFVARRGAPPTPEAT